MSILKSNNANFKITLGWLRKRGYAFYSYDPHMGMIKEGDSRYDFPFYATKSDDFFLQRKRLVLVSDYSRGELYEMKFYDTTRKNKFNTGYQLTQIYPYECERFIELEKYIDSL